jgi:predicted deacylase
VELRGEGDTDHGLALADADAILAFLRRRGVVAGAAGALPPARCQPTPLSGSEPIVAPHAGVLVFHLAPGAAVQVGDVVADVVDIDSGAVTPICARSAGVLYARVSTRWASAGMRVAKVAGTSLMRTGKLLSP